MRIRPSACVLLLVSSFCVAQEREQSHHSAPAIIVNGVQVTAGPFASMLEAFSKAFNPGQDNVSWPLYAYSIEQLGNDFCWEHGEKLSASAAAFVSPVSSGLIDRSPRYTGIQITDTSSFIDACMDLLERPKDFEQGLNDYLSKIEGFGKYLRDGRLEKLDLNKSLRVADACVRHLKLGTLSDASAGGHTELRLDGQAENTEQYSVELTWSMDTGSVELTWSTATDSAQRTITEMIESLNPGTEMWQFTPRDPGQFGGHFLISFNAPQEDSSRDRSFPSPSLWHGGDIEWEGMSGDDYYRKGSFDMWYLPPFCGEAADGAWYLVSKYRLGFDRDLGFRAWLAPVLLRPEAMNAARQFAVQ